MNLKIGKLVPKKAICFDKTQTKIIDQFEKPEWPINSIQHKRTDKLVA